MPPQQALFRVIASFHSIPTSPVTSLAVGREQVCPEQVASWTALTRGPFLWVILVLFAVFYFGGPLRRILKAIGQRIENGDPIEFGKFSLKGTVNDPSTLPIQLKDRNKE